MGRFGDGCLYIGRALADIDPDRVGRDLMFVYDGQSAFTIFRRLAKFSVEHFGLNAAITCLTLISITVWPLAMWFFVRAARPGRAMMLLLAAALILPRQYTPWGLFEAGEALAIPRPLAEAAVLLALGCLACGRPVVGGMLLAGAALVHPIMALPGFGVFFVVLGREQWRRWTIGALLCGTGLAVAGALGAPLLSRLFVRIDPIWLSILRERNTYLFLSSWPLDTISTVALQIITLLIASCLVDGQLRHIFRAIVAVAILGCATSYLLGDLVPLLLVVQLQPWRALWLTAAVAPFAAGICLWKLPDLGKRGRAGLAVIAAGWACLQLAPLSVLLSLLGAGILGARSLAVSRRMLIAVYTASGLAVALAVGANLAFLAGYAKAMPSGMNVPLPLVWTLVSPAVPLLAYTFAFARPQATLLRALPIILVLPSLGLVATYWNQRTSVRADIDAGHIKPDLVARLASRPGEVLWLGGDELWYWTRRANWNEAVQGAGLVFSRDFALIWKQRAQAVVDHKLAQEDLLDPWKPGVARPPIPYNRAEINDLCRRPDAPAWVVFPLQDGAAAPLDPDVSVWTSSFDERRLVVDGAHLSVRSNQRRAIVPCAPVLPKTSDAIGGPR